MYHVCWASCVIVYPAPPNRTCTEFEPQLAGRKSHLNAAYEDVGVGCYVRYKDINYHITFYYADHDLLAQTNSVAEYLQSRIGRRCDKEINVSDYNVSLFFADNGQTYAGAFIDSDHYYTVNTVASEEEMVEFIEALSFEPLPLV